MQDQSMSVLWHRDGPVGIVTINRPEKRNAINAAVQDGLTEAFDELTADDEVRAIVLTGAGDVAFSAGADMSERMANMESANTTPTAGDGYNAPARCPKPVIAAINGFCYGGATRLALNCDFRVGSPNAKFRFVGASYGIVVAATQLTWLTGPAVAKELLYTTRVVDAEESLKLGLLNHVYPLEALLDEAVKLGKQIAENSPLAVGWAKKVVDAATVVIEGLEAQDEADAATRRSDDHGERFREAAARITGGR
jgi:enoyl-CoA hydratase